MPLALAFVAGGLATLNPCGFSLLPALLTFYIGGDDPDGRTAGIFGALRTGALVAMGILGVFIVVAVPITLGASQIIRAVPWMGVVTGVALLVAGVLTLTGRHLTLPVRTPTARPQGHSRAIFIFGVAFGITSLGCTLPIFLSVIGASLASRGSGAALLVVGSYSLGMLAMVAALSIAAGLARDGLAARLRWLVPRIHVLGGVLLTLAGAYLSYYWGRVLWGPAATLGQDPIVGRVQRIVAGIERLAAGSGGWIVAVAAAVVISSVVTVALRRGQRDVGQTR